MHPRLFTVPAFELFGRMVGPLAMPTYGILLVLGMLAGLWIVTRQARKAGLVPETITDMAVYAIIAGLMGAKVLLLIVEWPFYSRNPRELLSLFQSGGVFYGGLLGAVPVACTSNCVVLPGVTTASSAAGLATVHASVGGVVAALIRVGSASGTMSTRPSRPISSAAARSNVVAAPATSHGRTRFFLISPS